MSLHRQAVVGEVFLGQPPPKKNESLSLRRKQYSVTGAVGFCDELVEVKDRTFCKKTHSSVNHWQWSNWCKEDESWNLARTQQTSITRCAAGCIWDLSTSTESGRPALFTRDLCVQVEEERAFHDQAHQFICDFVRPSGNEVAVGEGEFLQVLSKGLWTDLSNYCIHSLLHIPWWVPVCTWGQVVF